MLLTEQKRDERERERERKKDVDQIDSRFVVVK
jgi:hypothetical protein